MTQGKELRPQQALEIGFIDDVAHDDDELISKAKAWINDNPKAQQPWDKKGFKIPGGDSNHQKWCQYFLWPQRWPIKNHAYPAITHILSGV